MSFVSSSTGGYNVNAWPVTVPDVPRPSLIVGVVSKTQGVDPSAITRGGQPFRKIATIYNAVETLQMSMWILDSAVVGTLDLIISGGDRNTAIVGCYTNHDLSGAVTVDAMGNTTTMASRTETITVPMAPAWLVMLALTTATQSTAGLGTVRRQTCAQRMVLLDSGANVPLGSASCQAVTPGAEDWSSILFALPVVGAVAGPPPPVDPPPPPPPQVPAAEYATQASLTRTRDARVFQIYPPLPTWVLSGQSNAREVRAYLAVAAAPAGAQVTGWAEGGDGIENWDMTTAGWLGWTKPALEGLNVQAFVWSQGEADAGDSTKLAAYPAKFANLCARVRDAAGNPHLRIVIVEVSQNAAYAAMREVQKNYVMTDPDARLVNTEDLADNGGHFFPDGYAAIAPRIVAAIQSV